MARRSCRRPRRRQRKNASASSTNAAMPRSEIAGDPIAARPRIRGHPAVGLIERRIVRAARAADRRPASFRDRRRRADGGSPSAAIARTARAVHVRSPPNTRRCCAPIRDTDCVRASAARSEARATARRRPPRCTSMPATRFQIPRSRRSGAEMSMAMCRSWYTTFVPGAQLNGAPTWFKRKVFVFWIRKLKMDNDAGSFRAVSALISIVLGFSFVITTELMLEFDLWTTRFVRPNCRRTVWSRCW